MCVRPDKNAAVNHNLSVYIYSTDPVTLTRPIGKYNVVLNALDSTIAVHTPTCNTKCTITHTDLHPYPNAH